MTLDTRFQELKAHGRLPSPQGVALAVMRLAQDEAATSGELTRIIKADPALSGRIIKAANTVQFGGRRPVSSIPDAVVVLGLGSVRQLALGFSLVSQYRSGQCAAFDYDGFWAHSLATALAAQAIVGRVRMAVPEESFILGLLTRIGCLGLATVYPEEYTRLLENCAQRAVPELVPAEMQAFATDHNELTAALLGDWGLPQVLIEAVRHHENPAEGKFAEGSRPFVLAHVLQLATHLAEIGRATAPARAALLPNLYLLGSRIGLDAEKVGAIADEVVGAWEQWSGLLEIRGPAPQGLDAAACACETQAEAAPFEGHAEEALRLLVVDDDASTLMLLGKLLRDAGYAVYSACNGTEAMQRALACRPHLVVADWLMPEIDGLQFCRTLRQTEIGRGVYLVLLTAVEDESRLVEAFEAGVDDYVLKPVNPKMLLARLRAGERVVRLQAEVESDRERMRRFSSEVQANNRRLEQVALLDALTGIPNRRYATERIQQEWSAAGRGGRSLACMLIDVDHFKRINDTHGHDVGDLVLQRVADTLKHTARTQDVVCRIGGEEFLMLCPDTDAAAAAQCAERMRKAVALLRIPVGSCVLQLTISVGVAAMDAGMASPDSMLKAADQAVYAAKQAGRNRICTFRSRLAQQSGLAASA